MQDTVQQITQNRGIPVTLVLRDPLDPQTQKICKFANECQSSFIFTPEAVEGAVEVRVVDVLEDLLLFDATQEGGRISAAHEQGAKRLARLAGREYYSILSVLVGLSVLAVRKNESLIPEDLQPVSHPPCLFSPAQSELELLGALDQLNICPKCADFLCAVGLENEVLSAQQLLRIISDKRRDRSDFRWGLRGMERPPSSPL